MEKGVSSKESSGSAETIGPTLTANSVSLVLSGQTLLSGINLSFEPRTVSAILGPSGSGKSLLLKCLTSIYQPSQGSVTVDGRGLTEVRDVFRQSLGYVPQDDIIHTELKVEQAFSFAARLRLDTELDPGTVQQRIDRITQQLGLAHRKGHRISRLSGGQRKRINIGVELLADPRVLVLDEPASGLDPATEEDLLKILRRLAEQGRTVILTTHSMEYLDQVDRIVVLLEGAAIFSGTLERLLSHFEISHVSDLFKTVRKQGRSHWVQRWAKGQES